MAKILFDPENENRPYLGANAIIFKTVNGKEYILLGKRKNTAGAGYYYVPGGHVRHDETVNQSLIREVMEECGVEIKPGICLWIEESPEGRPHVILNYKATLVDEKAKVKNLEPQKCEGWQWYPVNRPPTPLWQTLEQFLKEYRNKTRIKRFSVVSKDYIGVGVGVILYRNKDNLEILLQKRGKLSKNEVGKWKFPGGQIEWGETTEMALKREIKEELGVEIDCQYLGFIDDILEGEDQHWLVPFYSGNIIKGEPVNKEPGKIDDVKWFSLDNLPDNLAFGTEIMLKIFKKN